MKTDYNYGIHNIQCVIKINRVYLEQVSAHIYFVSLTTEDYRSETEVKTIIAMTSCNVSFVVVCVTDIIKDSLCAYCDEDVPQFKTVVVFDCRGVEPTDFELRVSSFLCSNCINVKYFANLKVGRCWRVAHITLS